MSYRAQRIRDPLHNLTTFAGNEFESALWGVMQTRAFQRLRRVKQLGFTDFVFPGATHSRFAHSVGVFHVARRLMAIVREHLGTADFRQTRAEMALAAALVHDLGHGPFSHAFEEAGKELSLKFGKHETFSEELIRSGEVAEKLNVLGSGFANDVASGLMSERPTIYQAVVSSQFDADRLDYVQRDRLMTGARLGEIDFEWMLANLRVGKVAIGVDETSAGEIDTFIIGAKAISAVESYILGLFQMYPAVYFHKTTRGAEKLFTKFVVLLYKLVMDGAINKTGLPAQHPLIVFLRDPDSTEKFIELDDAILWSGLSQARGAKDLVLAELASRLWTRSLYKCTDARRELAERFGVNQRDKIDKACAEMIPRIDDWREENEVGVPRIIYDQATRHPYSEYRQSRGPVAQIRVQTTGSDSVDIDQRSEVLSGLRPFKLFRVYVRGDDSEAHKFVIQTIAEVSNARKR